MPLQRADGGHASAPASSETQAPAPTSPAPAESPDGRLVAFTSTNPQTRMAEIWVADADGANPHRLAAASRPATSRQGQSFQGTVHPSWASDGRSIALSSTDSGRVEVWTM